MVNVGIVNKNYFLRSITTAAMIMTAPAAGNILLVVTGCTLRFPVYIVTKNIPAINIAKQHIRIYPITIVLTVVPTLF
jgi:hypothetical protein